jgi:hypothetical protein
VSQNQPSHWTKLDTVRHRSARTALARSLSSQTTFRQTCWLSRRAGKLARAWIHLATARGGVAHHCRRLLVRIRERSDLRNRVGTACRGLSSERVATVNLSVFRCHPSRTAMSRDIAPGGGLVRPRPRTGRRSGRGSNSFSAKSMTRGVSPGTGVAVAARRNAALHLARGERHPSADGPLARGISLEDLAVRGDDNRRLAIGWRHGSDR